MTLASLGLFYLWIQNLNTTKDQELYQAMQSNLPLTLIIGICMLALISIVIGFIIKGKKVSEKLMVLCVVFSILLPYTLKELLTFYTYTTLKVITSDLKHINNYDEDFGKPLSPDVQSRYPNTLSKQEIISMRTRDNLRKTNLNQIMQSLVKYRRSTGHLPSEITSDWKSISNTGVGLCSYLIPIYINNIPNDPSTYDDLSNSSVQTCIKPYDTGYQVRVNTVTNKLELSAPKVEAENQLLITE